MVKRICLLYGDASLMIFSGGEGEAAALAQASEVTSQTQNHGAD